MKILFFLLFPYLLFSQELSFDTDFIFNENADHSNINTIFIADSVDMYEWEIALLKNNYNVIDRSKINLILNEQRLKLSGLTQTEKNLKIGQLVDADAFLTSHIKEDYLFATIYIKLISVESGEILFTTYLKISEVEYVIPDSSKETHDGRIKELKNWIFNMANKKRMVNKIPTNILHEHEVQKIIDIWQSAIFKKYKQCLH